MAATSAAPAARREVTLDGLLFGAAAFFAVAVLVHNSDHLRRGADAVKLDVFWIGSAAIFLEVGLVVLAVARHRIAPLASALVGSGLAAGYLLVHFLPARSWLSDSFTSAVNVSPLSWFAASLEVAAAVALATAGLIVLRRRGGVASAREPNPEERPLAEAVRHPLSLAMIVGNAIILTASIAQL